MVLLTTEAKEAKQALTAKDTKAHKETLVKAGSTPFLFFVSFVVKGFVRLCPL
jgi:hypothetical protein